MILATDTSQQLASLALTPQVAADYKQILLILTEKLCLQPHPAIVGISGAQGSGKSTLAALLATELNGRGFRCATVSLDDYYLSKVSRTDLANQIHPLMAQRGVPGSHDIVRALNDARRVLAGQPVALPVFDKARDDRTTDRPLQSLDLLIVEGWCLGLQPQSDADLMRPVNQLEAIEDPELRWRYYVNQQLAGIYQEYFQLLYPLIWLRAPDWQSICRWRQRQEQQLWQQRGTGMSEPQLQRFMLFFQRLTELSYQQLPAQASYTIRLNSMQHPSLSK